MQNISKQLTIIFFKFNNILLAQALLNLIAIKKCNLGDSHEKKLTVAYSCCAIRPYDR